MGYQKILTVNKKKGALSTIACAYIFTGESIILAHIDKQMQKEILAVKKAQLKSEGKGFIRQSVGMMKALNEYIDRYHNMTNDEILRESSMNFEIRNDRIDKITFRPMKTSYDAEMGNTKTTGKLVIKANGEKIKAVHNLEDNNREIKKYLKQTYGRIAK